jgi:hypothetical protein
MLGTELRIEFPGKGGVDAEQAAPGGLFVLAE